MWKVLFVALGLGAATPVMADEPDEFEGIYDGAMQISVGGQTRVVPLQLSLVLTGDTVTRPNGDIVQVIDGAFLVDGEGGAFPFNRVTFDLSDARIDMRYSRPMMDMGDETPANFRLVGTYRDDGSIDGRVLSGNRGPIGTFDVAWTRQIAFNHVSSYRGTWRGSAILPEGGEIPMTLQLVDAEGATTNPVDLEFDYTTGKLANVRWNNLSFSISNVTIDYLRGVVTLRIMGDGGGSDLSIEFVIDHAKNKAIGQIKSAYRGEIARFELPAVPSIGGEQ